MNKLIKFVALTLLLTQLFTCVKNKDDKEKINKSDFVNYFNTNSLKFTSGITTIFEDRKGYFWFGSNKEGVSFYNGKSFQYLTIREGLLDNQIRSIQEDTKNTIWLETANGVSSYDGKKITNHTPTTNFSKQKKDETTISNLWFGAGKKAGVYKKEEQFLRYLAFTLPKNDTPNNSYGVTDISKGKDGKVWIATYTALFYFDGNTVQLYDKSKLALKEDESLHIRSVFADSKGNIWIGNNGIGVLLLRGNSTINFSDKHGLIHPNSSKNGKYSPKGTLEHVFAIEEDSEGNIWFGDRDTGAWKFDGETTTHYTIAPYLSTPMILSIYKDTNNNLLFGMAAGGVYKLNGNSFIKLH